MKAEPHKFRQLFITKSAVLASKIRDYYLRLRQTLNASALSAKEMQKMRKEREQMEVIDLVDEDDVRKSLPSKWSELDDSHFPLFLSFDHFCSLLEADLGISRMQAGSAESERCRAAKMMAQKTAEKTEVSEAFLLDVDSREALPGGTALDRSAWAHVVDAEAFTKYYFPSFDARLTHNLDPLLCYSEFVAVIQGGLESLETEKVNRALNVPYSPDHMFGRASCHEKNIRVYLKGLEAISLTCVSASMIYICSIVNVKVCDNLCRLSMPAG